MGHWKFIYVCCKRLHSAKITFSAELASKRIVGPLFTRDTINSFRYINNFQQFVATFQVIEGAPENLCFMQEGGRTTPYYCGFWVSGILQWQMHCSQLLPSDRHWYGLASIFPQSQSMWLLLVKLLERHHLL